MDVEVCCLYVETAFQILGISIDVVKPPRFFGKPGSRRRAAPLPFWKAVPNAPEAIDITMVRPEDRVERRCRHVRHESRGAIIPGWIGGNKSPDCEVHIVVRASFNQPLRARFHVIGGACKPAGRGDAKEFFSFKGKVSRDGVITEFKELGQQRIFPTSVVEWIGRLVCRRIVFRVSIQTWELSLLLIRIIPV